MKHNATVKAVKGETTDYSKDFKVLSVGEKRGILKTAKTLLKVQKEDAETLADATPSQNQNESVKQDLA